MELLNKYIVRSEGISWRMIDGKAFLLNEEGMKMHLLNKVGSLIWEYSTGGVNIQNIITKIIDRFDVGEDLAQRDAIEFIEKLVDQKILTLCETPI